MAPNARGQIAITAKAKMKRLDACITYGSTLEGSGSYTRGMRRSPVRLRRVPSRRLTLGSHAGLQVVQECDRALRMRGCLEDRTLVVS